MYKLQDLFNVNYCFSKSARTPSGCKWTTLNIRIYCKVLAVHTIGWIPLFVLVGFVLPTRSIEGVFRRHRHSIDWSAYWRVIVSFFTFTPWNSRVFKRWGNFFIKLLWGTPPIASQSKPPKCFRRYALLLSCCILQSKISVGEEYVVLHFGDRYVWFIIAIF